MQIAMEVKRVLHRNPGNVKLEHFKIPFVPAHEGKKPKRKATQEEREEATRIAKAAWAARLGSGVKKDDRSRKTDRPVGRGR
jgi:hypothetical protein